MAIKIQSADGTIQTLQPGTIVKVLNADGTIQSITIGDALNQDIDTLNVGTIYADGDLVIDCGTNSTIRLVEPVYDDFIPSVTVFASGAASPDIVTHTIQSVLGAYWCFDGANTEERLTVKIEMYHGYKIGTDIEVHVHCMPSDNNTGDVVWYFDYFYSKVNAASSAGGTISKQFTVTSNSQYNDYTVSLGTISGTGLNIGDFIIGTLRRTPTSPDTYGADMLVKQIAVHCQMDTIGSRQRYVK